MAEVFYENGSELARVSNTFKVAGVATDPTTISLIITTPARVVTTYTFAAAEITRDSVGVYHKDIACAEDDVWQYVWVGTGTASDVVAGTWTVFSTALQRLYCTPEEFKERIRISDELDDFVIQGVLRASSRWIDTKCNRRFDRVSEVRTFPTGPAARVLCEVDFDDLVSVTTFKTDDNADGVYETTWTADVDYQLQPRNLNSGAEPIPYTSAVAIGNRAYPWARSWNRRTDPLQIDGVWGWPAVPDAIKQACALVAADLFKLRAAPFGIAGFGEFGGMRVRDNPAAMALIDPYRKHRILVG